MFIDLQAHRCPTAQVLVNRVLARFQSSMDNTLIIETIEPSMERSIRGRIAGFDLQLMVSEVTDRPVRMEEKTEWLNDFDEEDMDGVEKVFCFKITKAQLASVL